MTLHEQFPDFFDEYGLCIKPPTLPVIQAIVALTEKRDYVEVDTDKLEIEFRYKHHKRKIPYLIKVWHEGEVIAEFSSTEDDEDEYYNMCKRQYESWLRHRITLNEYRKAEEFRATWSSSSTNKKRNKRIK